MSEEKKQIKKQKSNDKTEEKKQTKPREKFNLDFGERLSTIRKEYCRKEEKKLTQQEISKEMGFGDNTLSSYETGSKSPSIKQLAKIKKYYKVSYDYLLGETDEPNSDLKAQADKNKKAINAIKNIVNNL